MTQYDIFNLPEYWNGMQGSYRPDASGIGYRDFPINDTRADYILSKHPGSVLDLGCGGGFIIKRLRARGVDAWGVDISQYCIDHFAPEEVKPYIKISNLTKLPFSDNQFDWGFSMGVLEHLTPEDVETACVEINRVCKQGIIAPCLSTELSAHLPVDRRDPTHKT